MSGWIESVVLALTQLGPWGAVLFVVAYIVASLTLAPAFVLTFAAGAVFGLWRGTLLVYVGAVLGASSVFAVASPLAQSRLLRWLDRDRRVAAVRRAVAGDVAKLAAGVAPPRGPEYYILLAVGLVATAVATTAVTRAAHKAMKAT